MNVVTIVYFSGYGQTVKQAEAVAEGIRSADCIAEVYRLTDKGDLPDGYTLEDIGQAGAIIYGAQLTWAAPPGSSRNSRTLARSCSNYRPGKTRSQPDLQTPPLLAATNSQQLPISGHWQCRWGRSGWGTGLLPASKKSNTPADINWSSGFGGAHAVSPADASVDEAPRIGDLETDKLLGKRVAELARTLA